MPIIRRSCRLQSCWFIVINAAAESTAEKYLLIHLTVNEERILESYFCNAVVQQMPHCMDTVLAALKNRTIRCSFCNETLLDYIGNLADDFCTMHLSAMFESKEAFIEKCIEAVCSHYIILCGAKGNFELALGDINYYLGVCEKAAKRRRIKRRSDEIYLGNLPFPEELSRSFSELLFIVSDVFGYLPLKLQVDDNGLF
jgi:hypothetical protein